MNERDKFIKQKKCEIEKIHRRQKRLIIKAEKLNAKKFKTMKARLRNISNLISVCSAMAGLEMQKQLIIAQPFPKFPKGAMMPDAQAIVGDSGKEEIVTSSTKFPK